MLHIREDQLREIVFLSILFEFTFVDSVGARDTIKSVVGKSGKT